MSNRIVQDPRIDPRITALFALQPDPQPGYVSSREELLFKSHTESAAAMRRMLKYPSPLENNDIPLDLHNNQSAVSYDYSEFEKRNPLAWPGFASEADVQGLVPTVISVNECDPLRDDGIEFYRLILRAGVSARCREVQDTIHGTEISPPACPDISRETAANIVHFCRHG